MLWSDYQSVHHHTWCFHWKHLKVGRFTAKAFKAGSHHTGNNQLQITKTLATEQNKHKHQKPHIYVNMTKFKEHVHKEPFKRRFSCEDDAEQ